MTQTSEVLAYAAAIIDGEGCIGIYTHGHSIALSVQATNTDVRLVDWFKQHFGDCTIECHIKKKLSICFVWKLYGSKAKNFLLLIKPYLVLKAEQADIAIEFQQYKENVFLGVGIRRSTEASTMELEYSKKLKSAKVDGIFAGRVA